jgi:flagellar motor switch protein FliM
MRSISVPSSINIIVSEKFGLNALVILESKLVIALVDVFFGGKGALGGYRMINREFTSIELNMLKKVAEGALKDINEAFKPVAELGFAFARSESNPQFAGILNEDDQVVVAEFDIGVEQVHGSVMVCLPHALIEIVKNRFNTRRSLAISCEPGSEWTAKLKKNLKDVNVEVSLELGKSKLTPRQISTLKKGDVIMLSSSKEDELSVKVEGQAKYYGVLGRTGENIAVEITRVIERPV